MSVVSLIPARGGSKGIKGKNLKQVGSMSLLHHAIDVSKKSQKIQRTFVSSDDPEILAEAKQQGALVPFVRPAELATDKTSDLPVIRHFIDFLDGEGEKPEIIVFLRPTNVFRTAGQIDEMVNRLVDSDLHSIRSVSDAPYPPFWMKKEEDGLLVPFLKGPFEEARRQELPRVVIANGAIEVIKVEHVLETNQRFGEIIGSYFLKDTPFVDIDTEMDLIIANQLFPIWKESLAESL